MNTMNITEKAQAFIKKNVIAIVFIVLCAVFPVFIKSNYWRKLMSEIFFFAALGCAWNIIGGFGRQTSWAHAAFFSAGAYSGVLMFLYFGASPWIGMLGGIVISVILAIAIGLPTFKLRGTYFAIATIACCTIVEKLLMYFSDFSGGSSGRSLPVLAEKSLWMLNFKNEMPFFYIGLVLMLLCVLLNWIIRQSRLGYYLRAIREDEVAAESLGIHTYRVKLFALIISAAITAIVGTIYAFRLRYVDPATFGSHDVAVRIGMIAIVGGLGTIWGPVLGAVLTVPLLQLGSSYLGNVGGGGLAWVIYGLIIILFVLFQPGGLVALFEKIFAALKKRTVKKNADKGQESERNCLQ